MFHNLMKGLTGQQDNSERDAHQHRHHTKKAAPVVKEKVQTHKIEEVQPVVERTVQQAEIQQVIQPVTDHQATTVHHEDAATLPVEEKVSRDDETGAVLEKYESNYADIKPEHVVEEAGDVESVVKEPVVEEKVEKHVVTEVQPVIERVVEETHVHHVTQPIKEYHAAEPVVADAVQKAPISIEEFTNSSDLK